MKPTLRHLSTAALLASLPLGVAEAQGLAQVGPVNPDHGFPEWYADSNGLQLDGCLTDAGLCVLEDGVPMILDEGAPFPANYGGLFADHVFYNKVEADMESGGNGGLALLVISLQGGFATEDESIVDGAQDVFARIRVRIDNLIAGEAYRVTTPVGTYDFIAENSERRGINFTDDVGRLEPGVFGTELGGALGPFLTWDSDLPIFDANGREYVGDPAIPHTITGSPFGTNVFRIQGPNVGGPGVNMIQTDLFACIGLISDDIANPPVADFRASTMDGTAPLPVAFTDLSTGDVTAWAWDFGDGNTSSAQSPIHTYEAAGLYTVSLTATGPDGSDTLTMADLINVEEIAPPMPLTLDVLPGLAGTNNTFRTSGIVGTRRIGVFFSFQLGNRSVNAPRGRQRRPQPGRAPGHGRPDRAHADPGPEQLRRQQRRLGDLLVRDSPT